MLYYVRIPLTVRCRTLPVHISYTTPTRSSFYTHKLSRNLEWKHSCSSGYSLSTGQVSITINQINIVDCYTRMLSNYASSAMQDIIGVTYSSFTIYSFTIYNRTISFYCTRCAAPAYPAGARSVYGMPVRWFHLYYFFSFVLLEQGLGGTDFILDWVLVDIIVLGELCYAYSLYLNSKCPLGTNMVLRAGWNSPRVFNSFCGNRSFLNFVLMPWCRDEVREPVGNPVGWDI